MTHRELLTLSGRLAEHGPKILQDCRGVSASALRHYLAANQQWIGAWSAELHGDNPDDAIQRAGSSSFRSSRIHALLEEIATSGVLVRVASTLLYSVGEKREIPEATKVAQDAAEAHARAAQFSVVSSTLTNLLTPPELDAIDQLGRLCERLSDLLCGAMMPHLECDRFVVDSDRAADFAETFGRFPALVRVPIRRASERLPTTRLLFSELADELKRSLMECLPTFARTDRNALDPLTDLTDMFRPQILRFGEPPTRQDVRAVPRDSTRLAFPTFSFSKALRWKVERQ